MVQRMGVSALHEDLLNLVRERPAFAVELAALANVHVPSFGSASVVDSTLNVTPIELHADKVVLLSDDKPVLGIVFEAQLEEDYRKEYTWPAYAAVSRSRNRCPHVVVVVTPSAKVAKWAAQPIELGCGTFRAIVLGPREIPRVIDPMTATEGPQLALLSLMTHGRGKVELAAQIATAVVSAVERFLDPNDPKQRAAYLLLIERYLSDSAREVFQMTTEAKRIYADVWYRAQATSLLRILAVRKLAVSDVIRQRIMSCTDEEQLTQWLERSIAVTTADELFA